MLAIAWLYFIFTGPGLADMTNRSMNNSILVELIRNGRWAGFNLERFLYVDSLVMIGMNLLLLGPIHLLFSRMKRKPWLAAGLFFFLLSLLRIPLYTLYLSAVDEGRTGTVLLLNWLVNKNNPILPYLSFTLFGGWFGCLLTAGDWKRMVRQVLPVGILLFLIGAVLYVFLPDTMLQRSIDGKWFAIMTAQLGLFSLLILLALRLFDFRKSSPEKPTGKSASVTSSASSAHHTPSASSAHHTPSASSARHTPSASASLSPSKLFFPLTFINRFGVAGLTAFFFESVLSAAFYRILRLFLPDLRLGLGGSLLYGFLLAITWGVLLLLWEKKQYRYGIEYFLCRLLAPFGHSEKQEKLGGYL